MNLLIITKINYPLIVHYLFLLHVTPRLHKLLHDCFSYSYMSYPFIFFPGTVLWRLSDPLYDFHPLLVACTLFMKR